MYQMTDFAEKNTSNQHGAILTVTDSNASHTLNIQVSASAQCFTMSIIDEQSSVLFSENISPCEFEETKEVWLDETGKNARIRFNMQELKLSVVDDNIIVEFYDHNISAINRVDAIDIHWDDIKNNQQQ
jgi:hypothetical protein